MANTLRSLVTAGILGVAVAGCEPKTKSPQKGDFVDVSGRIVRLNSWTPGTGPGFLGYPATTRDLVIVGPAGSFYHVSTTGPNKWNKLKVGNDVYLTGRHAGTSQTYKNMRVENIEYAELERRER
jgi:hypothetical protein